MDTKVLLFFLRLIMMILGQDRDKQKNQEFPVHTCDTTKCTGEYKIEMPLEKKQTVEITNTEGAFQVYPANVEIGVFCRRRLTIKCGTDMPLIGDGRCEEKIQAVNPSANDARDAVSKNECPTGYECQPDGDCTGEDRNKCDKMDMINKNGPSLIRWQGYRYKKWFKETCISSWECFKDKVNVSVAIEMGSDDQISAYYTTNKGEKVVIDDTLYDVGYTTSDGDLHFLIKRFRHPDPKTAIYKCYSSDTSNIKCFDTQKDSEVLDTPFKLDNKLRGILRNHFITITGKIKAIDNGKIINMYRESPHSNKILLSPTFNIQKSASLETVIEIIESIQTLQLQNVYNSEILDINIMNMYKVVRQVVMSLAKIDKKLVSKITSANYMTKWINEEIFEKCPCMEIKMGELSNCNGEYYYSQGTYYTQTSHTMCVRAQEDMLRNISLMGFMDPEYSLLKSLPPQESSIDSDAWTELNRLRVRERIEDEERGKVTFDSNNKIGDISGFSMSGIWDKNIFLYVTAVCFWLQLVVRLMLYK